MRSVATLCPPGFSCTLGMKAPCPGGRFNTAPGVEGACTMVCPAGMCHNHVCVSHAAQRRSRDVPPSRHRHARTWVVVIGWRPRCSLRCCAAVACVLQGTSVPLVQLDCPPMPRAACPVSTVPRAPLLPCPQHLAALLWQAQGPCSWARACVPWGSTVLEVCPTAVLRVALGTSQGRFDPCVRGCAPRGTSVQWGRPSQPPRPVVAQRCTVLRSVCPVCPLLARRNVTMSHESITTGCAYAPNRHTRAVAVLHTSHWEARL